MQTYQDELMHYGVKGMKWGVRRSRPDRLSSNKSDSAVTKRVKNDYNRLSDNDFKRRYSVSKGKYAKRVAKSKTGDPFADNRAKMTKTDRGQKRFDKAVKKEARRMTSAHLAEKADKIGNNRSTGSKIATAFFAGPDGNTAYNTARAAGSTKKGAALTMALLSSRGAINYADRKYQRSNEGTKYRERIERMYYN